MEKVWNKDNIIGISFNSGGTIYRIKEIIGNDVTATYGQGNLLDLNLSGTIGCLNDGIFKVTQECNQEISFPIFN